MQRKATKASQTFSEKNNKLESEKMVLSKDDDFFIRRKIIEDGRSFIAAFHRQDQIASFMDFLEQQDGWHSMRRHLGQDILKDMENRRHFVAALGANKDGKTYYLAREMDRLEQDWGLA